jgi:cytochrome b subunit of formate dehydrogenase
MHKWIRILQSYLILAFPFVLICMVWGTYQTEVEILRGSILTQTAWNILGWNIIVWFAALILFLALLIAMPSVREKTLWRLANIKDRDEREQYITGLTSLSTYISTLSLLIFFLFFSIFSMRIYRAPTEEAFLNM